MEVLFNATNLKSLITFVHLAGLAIGVGGAWMLDVFIINHLNREINRDKYLVIEFVSKFVCTGLLLLWVSGFLFIGYYYLFTPEFLANQKVWGKMFIVIVLTLNGLLVHKVVLPKIKASIGQSLLGSLGSNEIKKVTLIGIVSVVSWLFPVILGVTKTLNFTAPAINIIFFYIAVLIITSLMADLVLTYFLQTRRQTT